MRDAVIVAAVRTPVGKRNGALAGVHPVDLSAHVLNALAERAGLADPAEVDDVIWGCVSQVGEQTFAAAGLVSGQYDMVVAGGVESMSRVPMGASIGATRANPSGSGLQTVFGG